MSALTAGDRAAIDRNLMGAKADLRALVDLARDHLATTDPADVVLELIGYVADCLAEPVRRGLLVAALMELAAVPQPESGSSAAGSVPPG